MSKIEKGFRLFIEKDPAIRKKIIGELSEKDLQHLLLLSSNYIVKQKIELVDFYAPLPKKESKKQKGCKKQGNTES